MKYLALAFLIYLLLLLEATVAGFPLILPFLIALSFWEQERAVIWLGFLSGLGRDLLLSKRLGMSGLIFLLMVMGMLLYRKRFSRRHVAFLVVTSFFLSYFLSLIDQTRWYIWQGLMVAGLAFIFTYLLAAMPQIEREGKVRL